MNKLYTLIIAAVLLTSGTIQAQEAKFGHVNSQELLQMMPETATAEKSLVEYQSQLEKRLQEIQATYQADIAKFQELPEDTPQSTVNEMRDGILGMEQRMQEYQVNAERELMTKREALLTPIITKLEEAIQAVGTENGFTYIFDISTGVIVFQEGGEDVTPFVKTKLGITG